MPWIVAASGTQAASVGVEHTLATLTTNGTYVFVVDTGNMVNSDVTELRLYTKVLDGGTSRVAYMAIYAHAQSQPQKYSVPVPVSIEVIVTLKQTAGTGRNFPWAILRT